MEMQGVTDRARVVMWELTRACKLACAHCPIGAQPRRSPLELSTYEAYKTIDQIVSLNPDEVMKKVSNRMDHSHPPMPKMIVPTTVAARAPLLSRLWARYAAYATMIARSKPNRICI